MTASILDTLTAIKELDTKNVLGSAQSLADQIEDAWNQVKALEISVDHDRVQNIVVVGMGGSQLGPHIIDSVFKNQLHVPLEIFNDYHLPAYVNEHSLVLLSSYSGTTEEVLQAAEEAGERGAQALFICTGGKLAEMGKERGWPGYLINPQFNPSGQPRMAIGYAVFGTIAMLIKAGLLKVSEEEVASVVARVRETTAGINVDIPQETNPAKQMAFHIAGRIPVLIAAEHLEGAVHAVQNQINENSKSYAEYRVIPEMNHHLMEGLRFPEKAQELLFFLTFNSTLYDERIQKRMQVTQTVLERAGMDHQLLTIDSATPLEQAFEILAFGSFVNFYLAMLHGIDPAPIETVDFFKAELKK